MAIDVTNEVIDFLKRHFVGQRVEQPLMTFDDNTRNGVGHKIKARGEATIGEFTSHDGKIEKDRIFNGFGYQADIKLIFRYDGQTHGEKWLYPGGAFVDNVWNNLHPSGEIEFHITADQQSNWAVNIISMTFGDIHDDNPNRFVRDQVATKFINVMTPLLTTAVAETTIPVG